MNAADIAKALSCGRDGCGCGQEISPGTWRTHCPVHDDEHPSFDVTQKGDQVLWFCQAGCTQEATGAALKEKQLWPSRGRGDRAQMDSGLSLAGFAQAKKLEISFLAKQGVTQATGKGGLPYLVFHYQDPDGKPMEQATRFRFSMTEKPKSKKGGTPALYGLWRLADFRPGGEIIICEGESDTLTFWNYDLPAVGIPGKGLLKTINPEHFKGFHTVYVWQEPDAPELPGKVAARLPGVTVKALIPPEGVKDNSEVHCQGVNVPELLAQMKAQAQTVTPAQGKQGAKKRTEESPLTIDDLQDSRRLHPVIDFRPHGMILGFRVPLPKTKDGPTEGLLVVVSAGQNIETPISPKKILIADEEYDLSKGSPPYLSDVWSLDRLKNFLPTPYKPDPQSIFTQIKDTLRTYLDLPEEVYGLLAAWGAGTYFAHLFAAYPFLHFFGPKECGKSKSLEALRFFCFNAFKGRDITAAALGDTVDGQRGTVLIDQAEKLGQTSQPGELNLVGLLADSYKAAGGRRRVVEMSKAGRKVMEFSTYGPKAFASTKPLDPDLADRCVKISMTRTRRNLPDLEGWEPVWIDIRDSLYRLALTSFQDVLMAYAMTQGNGTRLAELWRPMGAMLAVMLVTPQEEQAIKSLFFEQARENRAEPSPWEAALLETLMDLANDHEKDFSQTSDELLETMGIDGDHRPGPKWLGEALSKYNIYENKKRQDKKTDDGKRKALTSYTFLSSRVRKLCELYLSIPDKVCGVCGVDELHNDNSLLQSTGIKPSTCEVCGENEKTGSTQAFTCGREMVCGTDPIDITSNSQQPTDPTDLLKGYKAPDKEKISTQVGLCIDQGEI